MQQRTLGRGDVAVEVSAEGPGCMGTIDVIDTADMYGPFTNEKLVGKGDRCRRASHLTRILPELGVTDRTQAELWAERQGVGGGRGPG